MRFTACFFGALGLMLALGGVAQAAPTAFDTYGQPALEAIHQSYLTGEISEAQALLYRFYFVKSFDKLPAQYQLLGAERARCGTPILMEVYSRLNELPTAMLNEIQDQRSRPSGLSLTRTTTHYIIHYTLTGVNASTEEYIDMIAVECEVGWTAFHTTRTWDVPPSDGTIGGGNGMIDCYVWSCGDGLLGYAEPENPVPGDPPNDYTGFFNVQHDMTQHDADATTVHEYMHVVQFGYYGSQTWSWFMENCATMGEEMAYDGNNDYRQRFSPFFAGQYQSLSASYFDYVILWPMYIYERFSPETLELIWDDAQWRTSIWTAIDNVLGPLGYNYHTAYYEFIKWCYYTGARNDGQHYQEAGSWSNMFYPDLTITDYPSGEEHPSTVKMPDPMGTSIMRFNRESGNTDDILDVVYNASNCSGAVQFMVKTGDTYLEHYFTPDGTGGGTFDVPGLATCDYIFMMASMQRSCQPNQDYAFWADTQAGNPGSTDESLHLADRVRIYPTQPNPTIDYTTVRYELSQPSAVTVRILDASGRVVRNLYGGTLHQGSYELQWDARDDGGSSVASGVYYAQIATDGGTQTREVTVLR
jgi:hypothetical protein